MAYFSFPQRVVLALWKTDLAVWALSNQKRNVESLEGEHFLISLAGWLNSLNSNSRANKGTTRRRESSRDDSYITSIVLYPLTYRTSLLKSPNCLSRGSYLVQQQL
uniref:Uncharacterized protein n=1 Tax=Utricularia reniformis TaxID=192314 RepID=A0A1Y0B1U8_9LAMI|nr:hypothetical protein AEK19_MT1208 [Utricularia reniformis]ART31422.1 hypothetical protein AEK19_MT1208 [Utricularia reniformis]